jgi:hypothetical protein
MTDQHNQSFFGQNVAMFVRSSSKYDDFIFIQSIKRKGKNNWEKPSKGEGKNIKLSLGEMIMILKVLDGVKDSWSTYHRYKDENTQISFNWQESVLWINIGEYAKKLQSPNIEILNLLLNHLIKEKIEFATGGSRQNNKISTSDTHSSKLDSSTSPEMTETTETSKSFQGNKGNKSLRSPKISRYEGDKAISPSKSKVVVKEEIINLPSNQSVDSKSSSDESSQNPPDAKTVKGTIQRATSKALLIRFEDGNEVWIPKSTIFNQFSADTQEIQPFLIQSWVLEKNNAIS